MQLEQGMILQHITDQEKQISCIFQEETCKVPLADTVVWWKRAWHWVKTNQLGDGMQVPVIQERPFLLNKVDPKRIIQGMSIYQEFDEDAGIMKTYCYKFPKDEAILHRTQEIMYILTPGYTLVCHGRFVQLRGEQVVYPQDVETFSILLMHAGISAGISFLYGLCLAYGDVQVEMMPDSVHVTIPLVGSIASREPYIQTVLKQLQSHGMYVSMQIQDQSFGQVMQVRITDWEIITIFASWLGIDHAQVLRKKTYETMKGSLLQWLGKQSVDQEFLDTVSYSVIKVLKK